MSRITKSFAIKVLERRKNGGRIIISTPSIDRDKDRVIPDGGDFENYKNNPVVQWSHGYSEPWQTVGRTNQLEASPEGIIADFELRPAANDQDPQNIVKLLWEGGWVKTASIGFIPKAANPNKDGGNDFTQWELLEWSITPVPANPTALALAMKVFKESEPFIKSPDYRLPDETVDACNARKFQELMDADPSLSEADARAEAARICSQDAPAADQPADAPADAPTQDQQNSAKGEGDMAQYMQELGAHLAEAVSLFNELVSMMQPAPQDAPADAPAASVDAPEGKAVTKRGRVLSAGNESKLRTAHSNIGEVLSQLGEDAPEQASAGKSADELADGEIEALAALLGDLPKMFIQ